MYIFIYTYIFFFEGRQSLAQGWRTFLRARLQLSVNFEKILSRARGNFEGQNKVLEFLLITALLLLMHIIIYCMLNI